MMLLYAARCLDQYFELRVKQVEQKEQVDIDPRLVDVVERMLDRCALHGTAHNSKHLLCPGSN
jgi:hypothetical protein